MKNKLIAVIPVRAGSQRVKNKNFKSFSNSNLLEIKINQMKMLPLDDIVVNTDSETAINIAIKNGVSYYEREKYYASSECTNSEYHEYLAKVTNSENILIAQVTSPLVRTESYRRAINMYFQNGVDSLISVEKFQNFLLYNGMPVNYEFGKMPNSQNLPIYKVPTFGLVICKRDKMIEYKNYICGKTEFYDLDQVESIDIDTEIDFEIAEFLYNRRKVV